MRNRDEEVEEEVNVRVRNGARWLDENFPGWVDRIDLETLNLANSESCICGQVFEQKSNNSITSVGLYWSSDGYDYAFTHLFDEANSWITALVRREPKKGDSYRAVKVAQQLGFMSDWTYGNDPITFEDLQEGWETYLQERITTP